MPALTPAVCRTALQAFLESVDSTSRVYPQRRRMRTDQEVATVTGAIVGGQQRIRTWMIAPAEENPMVTTRNPGHRGIGSQTAQSNDMVTLQFQVIGYLSVDDANDSEQTAMDLAYTVAEALNSYGIIPGLEGYAHLQVPADVEQFRYAMLAGTFLCHYVTIGIGWTGKLRP